MREYALGAVHITHNSRVTTIGSNQLSTSGYSILINILYIWEINTLLKCISIPWPSTEKKNSFPTQAINIIMSNEKEFIKLINFKQN